MDWVIYTTLTINESGFYTPGDATIDAATTTTDVIGLGSGSPANRSGAPIVAYCWAEIPGYSKFNTYVGNGSTTDGTICLYWFCSNFSSLQNDRQ